MHRATRAEEIIIEEGGKMHPINAVMEASCSRNRKKQASTLPEYRWHPAAVPIVWVASCRPKLNVTSPLHEEQETVTRLRKTA